MCPLDRRHRSWNLALHLQGWFFHWHYPKDPLQDQVWQDSTSKEGVHAKQGKHGYLHWWIFKIQYFQPTKPCKKTLQCYKSTQTSIPLSDDVECRCMIKKQDYFINAHPSCRKAFLIKKNLSPCVPNTHDNINNRFMTLYRQCCFLSACECNSNAAVNRKKANEKTPLETISNSFKHIRPGWWFAFIRRVTCHVWSWCTSITLRTLVHSSMQRPAKSSAIRWGSRENVSTKCYNEFNEEKPFAK